jgi:hypothetical protein
MTARNPLVSLSGAELRALEKAGDAAATAELARRQAKREASGKVTVAALRSWGRTTEAEAIVAHAKAEKAAAKAAAPAKAPKAAPAPVAAPTPAVAKPKAVAFTRTNERVDQLTTRVQSIEGSILALAASQASMKEVLDVIARKLI